MISEMERKNRDELFKLMQENPELPIVAMVDTEVVAGDDFGRWIGALGYVYVDEYLIPPEYDEPILFKSNDDVFDTLERYLPAEEFNALPESEQECREIYNALPWTKAIIVNIDLLD